MSPLRYNFWEPSQEAKEIISKRMPATNLTSKRMPATNLRSKRRQAISLTSEYIHSTNLPSKHKQTTNLLSKHRQTTNPTSKHRHATNPTSTHRQTKTSKRRCSFPPPLNPWSYWNPTGQHFHFTFSSPAIFFPQDNIPRWNCLAN